MELSRRSLIRASALLAMLPSAAWAREHHGTDLTPEAALKRLVDGNIDFKKAIRPTYPIDDRRRREIAKGQKPFATIVCCSDSRVGPEQVFSQGLGELFVVRNAGTTAANPQAVGSVEYSVLEFGVPLIVVLGHSKCGAVKETIHLVKDNVQFPGTLKGMLLPLLPAVLAARDQQGDWVENAVRENVRRVTRSLRSPTQPILYPPLHKGELKVVGAVYDLETGVVDVFDHAESAPH